MTEDEMNQGLRKLRLHHHREAIKSDRNFDKFVDLHAQQPLVKSHAINASHANRRTQFHKDQVEFLNKFLNTTVEQDELK